MAYQIGTSVIIDDSSNILNLNNISASGIITAASFSGDGSGLIGVAATDNVRTDTIVVSGVSTLGNTIVGGATTELIVEGDARVTGILTIGTSSITLDGTENQVNVGTGVTLHHSNGIQVGGNTVHSTGLTVNQINVSGVSTVASLKVGTGGTIITANENGFIGFGTTNPQGTVQIGAGVTIQGDSGIVRASNFYGSGANLSNISVGDGTVTSAKIVSNSTDFDLDRKKLYLPRGFYRYNTDAVSDPHGQLNNMPYGPGYFWSAYSTESGYAANGATVTARLMNGVPAGLVIIELTSASHGGGNPYGNSYGGGCEILAWEPAHHGWSGGSTSVIATRGTLYGSYTTGGAYGVYVTGGANGTYWRVTFIH